MADEHLIRERFTDEEAAFLRHVRFGELPPRVLPSDYVEVVETDPPHDRENERTDPRVCGMPPTYG
jgi:hypothetical protein